MLILTMKSDGKKIPKSKSAKEKSVAKKSKRALSAEPSVSETVSEKKTASSEKAVQPSSLPVETALTQEELVEFERAEAFTDEELATQGSELPKEPIKLTRAEIEKQRDFQKEAMVHIDSLYNFALRMTGDPEDANDLVQETYMKAYRFFDSFEKGTNCKAWLFRILKNSYINKYRKESKEPDKVDYDDIKEFYHTVKHSSLDSNDMQEKLFNELLDDEVARALDSLPEDFREVVQLCDIEGFTYEEIANMVDCPIGTVRSRLHRGRKILREKLLEYARQHGYKVNPDTHPDNWPDD